MTPLLLGTQDTHLSDAIRGLQVSYSSVFNWTHRLRGQLFQGRFRSLLIEDHKGAVEVARYLHLNPVRVQGLGSGIEVSGGCDGGEAVRANAERWPGKGTLRRGFAARAQAMIRRLLTFGARAPILRPMPDVTQLLHAIEAGEPKAAEQLLPLVYEELRRLAAARMAHEKPGQTLQATALVHEAWLRLAGPDERKAWNGRGHFFGAAAEAMRRILVDRARQNIPIGSGTDIQLLLLVPTPSPGSGIPTSPAWIGSRRCAMTRNSFSWQ